LQNKSIFTILFASTVLLSACTSQPAATGEGSDVALPATQTLTVYSGRSESFIQPFFDEFEAKTGIKVDARYGDSAELAAQILEEGANSPADVFLSQDAGAIGAITAAGLLNVLDQTYISQVPNQFSDPNGSWVGITGRARVVAYDPELIQASDVPTTIDDLLNPQWRSIIGIAPANSSFQSFVTAMRQMRGDEKTLEWLEGLAANQPQIFEKNSQIIEAIDTKVIGLGLTNHYYAYEVSESLGKVLDVKNGFFQAGDPGNLLNVSAFGVLKTSNKSDLALELLTYLLSKETQSKFVSETSEYSLLPEVSAPADMPALSDLDIPKVVLGDLSDVAGTQDLLIKAGLL
jgi:iron(III) transport system substrate-binding protein